MTISLGGFAFTGYNMDGTDDFSIVILEDLAASETVYFTDSAWTGTAFQLGETTMTWTTGGPVSAGTVVTFSDVSTSPSASVGTLVGSLNLSFVGDSILAYQGSAGSPSAFIAGLATDENGFGQDGGTLAGTGLAEGTNAVNIGSVADGIDGAVFNGPRNTEMDFADYAAEINDPSNWDTTTGVTNGVAVLPFDTTAFSVVCFAEGTLIATPGGEVPVEKLQPGDRVNTLAGRDVAVTWVGKQTIVKAFCGARAQLVRIRKGMLGNHSDLYVTADLGMVIDGLVINASVLVDGDGIAYVPMADTPARFAVYHVETEAHDVILANGAASESYVDTPGRAAFDNYQDYLDRYGSDKPIPAIARARISTQRLLPESIRRHLSARSAGSKIPQTG